MNRTAAHAHSIQTHSPIEGETRVVLCHKLLTMAKPTVRKRATQHSSRELYS